MAHNLRPLFIAELVKLIIVQSLVKLIIVQSLVKLTPKHRDILLEATSSQKLWATKVSTGNQGGEPTLGH